MIPKGKVIRKVGAKRARVLRRRGTHAWWSDDHNSYVWEMDLMEAWFHKMRHKMLVKFNPKTDNQFWVTKDREPQNTSELCCMNFEMKKVYMVNAIVENKPVVLRLMSNA